ncbi:MAG: hypothetical protein LKG42_08260 [Eubacterium sp.]|jgi:8-oxo-dGTP diphosphatase|nr:hypothetical protein [Eubacterium sp.]MCH4045960.1 hypothetical protein [Eubacterium sp.]MCH4079054.1 hypothetical protein [Eubacterium sp.]MCH4111211.1 hypothetical protein [Eubacterium sp.]MCI1307996.1 hypothetical protein [Eubacterium sp.]
MKYEVTDIEEADYGCEECPPDGPHAVLVLKDEKGQISRKEVSEKWISAHHADVGNKLDGEILG